MAVFLISSIFVVYHLAMNLIRHRKHRFTQLLYVIGTYSFGAYLSHAMMLRVGYYVDEWLFTELPVALRMMAVQVIAVLLSVTLTYHLSQLPYGKWFVGLSTRAKVHKNSMVVEE
jgi:membrane-bound acyltransferase YfiQ involved in biofilm formation